MLVKLKTRVISETPKVSQKTNKPYRIINFMDDNIICNAMCKSECTTPIVPFDEYVLTLDVSIKYGSCKIVDIERAN